MCGPKQLFSVVQSLQKVGHPCVREFFSDTDSDSPQRVIGDSDTVIFILFIDMARIDH